MSGGCEPDTAAGLFFQYANISVKFRLAGSVLPFPLTGLPLFLTHTFNN